jgi:O-antigen/teichoic acid export membrane protein
MEIEIKNPKEKNKQNTSRIFKNTIFLYLRMVLVLGITLYTSRVVLNTLGVVDYGIFNVVGGIVIMFSFLNSSMTSATQRFLSFEIGLEKSTLTNEKLNTSNLINASLQRIFCMSLNIHFIIGMVIFFLAETLGIWFLNYKMNIPSDRIIAANWVFQFSLFSFLITILGVPYNAMIIAQEKMKAYAYVSIIEVTLKLAIVFLLVWVDFDKLKVYSILIFLVSIIIWILYKEISKRVAKESEYIFFWDKGLYHLMMNYAVWNLFGNLASVSMSQGVNILLNIFFGPTVNAARAISYQIKGAIIGFFSNFQLAMNPQIIKSYASKDISFMHEIIFRGSKFSYFLLLLFAIPVFIEIDAILVLWLKNVPDYTKVFCRLIIVNTLIDSISGPLMTAAQATGKIKIYQSVVGTALLLILPVSYFFLKFGFEPEVTFYVSIAFSIIALNLRLVILKPLIKVSITKFFKEVILNILIVSLLSFLLPTILHLQFEEGTIRLLLVILLSMIGTIASIYFFGIDKQEKTFIEKNLSQFYLRFIKR